MAAASLREDRWLVHHLATDLPVAEVARLALEVAADIVVLSCATSRGLGQAVAAASDLTAAHPDLAVLVGRSGDSLYSLRQQARNARGPGADPR